MNPIEGILDGTGFNMYVAKVGDSAFLVMGFPPPATATGKKSPAPTFEVVAS
mgnify:CR=1 FL=1